MNLRSQSDASAQRCIGCDGTFKITKPGVENRSCRRCKRKAALLAAGWIDEIDVMTLGRKEFDELADYMELGLSLEEAGEWLGTDLADVTIWMEAGFSASEAADWDGVPASRAIDAIRFGLSSIDQLDHFEPWRAWGVSAPSAVDEILESVEFDWLDGAPDRVWQTEYGLDLLEAIAWEGRGFSPGDHLDWVALNVGPDSAHRLRSEWDFEPSEVGPWLKAGVTADDVLEIAEIDPNLIATDPTELRRAGVPLTEAGLERWGGLSAEQIHDAVDRGFENAASYRPYGSSAMTADQVDDFHSRGYEKPAEIIEAAAAESLGLEPKDLREWCRAGFDAGEVVSWRRTGLEPIQAFEWRVAGFRPKTVKSWIDANVDSPLLATQWKSAGARPAEAKRWREAGVDVDLAIRWAATADIDTALRRIAAGLTPPDL